LNVRGDFPIQPGDVMVESIQRSGKATASLVLGLLSFGLWLIAGIPALILGVLALRDIERSRGRLTGQGRALTGVIAGGVSSLMFIPLAAVLVFILLGSIQAARETQRRSVASENLRQIGEAIRQYEQANPPAPPTVIEEREQRP
jgi:ABC-type Na+ efflux pump permease subunit